MPAGGVTLLENNSAKQSGILLLTPFLPSVYGFDFFGLLFFCLLITYFFAGKLLP